MWIQIDYSLWAILLMFVAFFKVAYDQVIVQEVNSAG
jgi:hypothetical protein